MKNKINISILIIVILLSIFCIVNISLAQNDKYDDECNKVEFQREKGLIYRVLNYNLGYLAICVGIILLLGGFFYLFNFVPLIKKIENQEENLKELRRENEKRFLELIKKQNESLKSLKGLIEEKLNSMMVKVWNRLDDLEESTENKSKQLEKGTRDELDAEIKKSEKAIKKITESMDKKINAMDALESWYRHYTLEGRNAFVGALKKVLESLEKAIDYNVQPWSIDLCLEKIIEILDRIEIGQYSLKNYEILSRVLDKVIGFEVQKDKIMKKAEKLLVKE